MEKDLQKGLRGMLFVEFVLKNLMQPSGASEWFKETFSRCGYSVVETNNRLIVDVPIDWVGFRDGTVNEIMEHLREGVYIAIAYVSSGGDDEVVTSISGEPVDTLRTTLGGRPCVKYIKKNLRILKRVNKLEDCFEVKGFVLNLSYKLPVLLVLDVFSIGTLSGVGSDRFTATI